MKYTVSSKWDLEADKLDANRDARKRQVETYFKTITSQMVTLSQSRMIVDAIREFKPAFNAHREETAVSAEEIQSMRVELASFYTGQFNVEYEAQNGERYDVYSALAKLDDDAIVFQSRYIQNNQNPPGSKHLMDNTNDGSEYAELHSVYHPPIRAFLEEFGYCNIFLVNPDTGDIVYSVFKELDYGTSLIDGHYARTNFGECFRTANDLSSADETFMVDYKQYSPSYEAPASFIASPIYDGKEKLGVLIFQMPLDRLTEVMTAPDGLGKTGETMLIGPDFLPRSDSRHSESHSVVGGFRNPETGKYNAEIIREGFETGSSSGKYGLDYRDKKVVASVERVDIAKGITWVLVSKKDLTEFAVPISRDGIDYYANYVERKGHKDFLLVAPDGDIFYSTNKGKELHTNLKRGKYKTSTLAKVVEEIAETKKYTLSDYANYAALDQEVSQFAGEALFKNGEPVLTLVFRLDLNKLQTVMSGNAGLAETGETILIGGDYRMRTDSRISTDTHTPEIAFSKAGLVDGLAKVETAATRAVIGDGKSGVVFTKDYRGQDTIIAYTPVDVGGNTWSLNAKGDVSEAFAATAHMEIVAAIIALIVMVGIIGTGLFFARSMTRPIVSAADAMARVAKGDLTIRLDTKRKDELGDLSRAINATVESLDNTLIGVLSNAEHVATNASSVQTSNSKLSERTDEQASALEETSATLEEISSTVRSNAENTEKAADLSAEANVLAESGNASVDSAVAQMGEIQESSRKIVDIIATVNDIAFQTNLLALNAAVEAARAGDQGRGFAVVATEVRSLAHRSSQAAKEIKDLIEDSVKKVEAGQAMVNETGKKLTEIRTSVAQVTDLVKSLSGAATEQTTAVDEINRAISQLDQVTQSNAIMVRDSAVSAVSLSEQSTELRKRVSKFTLSSKEGGSESDGHVELRDGDAESNSKTSEPESRIPDFAEVSAGKDPDWDDI
ncbi:MAG: methyl-accepting chemotaxis protein [Planctomycetes bacterium]|nr:methyl-accepting chemotaxis protein [Planctomycetota bacterium]